MALEKEDTLDTEDEDKELGDVTRTPRHEKLSDIYSRFEKNEYEDIVGSEELEQEEEEETPSAEAPKETPAPVAAAPTPGPQSQRLEDYSFIQDGVAMLRVKIDGVEKNVPLETVRANLQRYEAGEERLRQSTLRARELQEYESRLKAYEQSLRQNQAAVSASPPKPGVQDEDIAVAKSFIDELVTGKDEEKAARMFAELIARGRTVPAQPAQPTVQADDIRNIAASVVQEANFKRSIQDAWDRFRGENQELLTKGGAPLIRMIDEFTDVVQAEDPALPPYEVMTKARDKATAWLNNAAAAANPQPTSARQQRKAQMTRLPQTRSAEAVAPTPQEDNQPSLAEVIGEMRKARGQPV